MSGVNRLIGIEIIKSGKKGKAALADLTPQKIRSKGTGKK